VNVKNIIMSLLRKKILKQSNGLKIQIVSQNLTQMSMKFKHCTFHASLLIEDAYS